MLISLHFSLFYSLPLFSATHHPIPANATSIQILFWGLLLGDSKLRPQNTSLCGNSQLLLHIKDWKAQKGWPIFGSILVFPAFLNHLSREEFGSGQWFSIIISIINSLKTESLYGISNYKKKKSFLICITLLYACLLVTKKSMRISWLFGLTPKFENWGFEWQSKSFIRLIIQFTSVFCLVPQHWSHTIKYLKVVTVFKWFALQFQRHFQLNWTRT